MRVLYYSALEGNELSQMIFRTHIAEVHKLLADYIKQRIREGAGIALAGAAPCPSCGEKALVREEGCWKCQACGYAKCG